MELGIIHLLFTVLFLCLLFPSLLTMKCSFSPGSSQILECSVHQQLGGNQNESILLQASSSAGRAKSIQLTCNDTIGQLHHSAFQKGDLPLIQHLSLRGCEIDQIPQSFAVGLRGLLTIKISNSASHGSPLTIDKNRFLGLQQLQTLELTDNQVYSFPSGTFCSLPSLISLNLSRNNMQEVTDLGISPDWLNSTDLNLQTCLTSLQSLDLSDNQLSELPSQTFVHLNSLHQLNIEFNNIGHLVDNTLEGLRVLEKINLSNNLIVALPPNVFKKTPQLKEINVQNNSLSALGPELFTNLSQLLVLNLSYNELSDDRIHVEAFKDLIHLVALDLSHNHISKIESKWFEGLSFLKILNLENNKITTISSRIFIGQNNLHVLNLSYNQISQIERIALSGLSVLNELHLNHNNLQQLPSRIFLNCSSLQDIFLNNNQIRSMPRAINFLHQLKKLDLGDNRISELEDTSLEGLESLYSLSLAGNNLSVLSRLSFDKIPTIKVLNLAHNRISKLGENKDVFQSLKSLSVLRLDDNKITDLNGLLTSQKELKWLNISSNRLRWFDYAFIPKNLEWIDTQNNQINELGNYYQLNKGFVLKFIDASFNKIWKLSKDSFLPSLEDIYINNNQLEDIAPHTFSNLSKLRRVELTDNKIETIKLAALTVSDDKSVKTNVPEFYIGQNPFLCDCHMDYLKKINDLSKTGRYPNVMDLKKITCSIFDHRNMSIGENRLMRPLTDTLASQFLCQYKAHCFALCHCCEFSACECRMECPEGCDCFHDATWTNNIIECSARNHSDVPPLVPMDATSVYLDGNNFGNFVSQAFKGRKSVTSLFLNSSGMISINKKAFDGLIQLEILHLEHNLLSVISKGHLENLTNLREIYLNNNKLHSIEIDIFSNLSALQVIFLHNNRLSTFPIWQLPLPEKISALSLANNSWPCDNSFILQFQNFLTNNVVVLDTSQLYCVDFQGTPRLISTVLVE